MDGELPQIIKDAIVLRAAQNAKAAQQVNGDNASLPINPRQRDPHTLENDNGKRTGNKRASATKSSAKGIDKNPTLETDDKSAPSKKAWIDSLRQHNETVPGAQSVHLGYEQCLLWQTGKVAQPVNPMDCERCKYLAKLPANELFEILN